MAGRKGEKIWADAVRRAVNRRLESVEGQPKKLEHLAEKIVELGLDGDMQALKEIADRLDGKAHQSTSNTHEHDVSDPLRDLLSEVAARGRRITE